jgi:molybdopterin-guanine dinucleotide biosynthesis protein A
MTAPLYGLVLTGGRSRRMQRDKAALEYAGQPQLTRAIELLRPLVMRYFVSVRAGQDSDAQRAAHDRIADLLPDRGPLGGIHAALHAHPQAAWLVLACDLPFLDVATLQQLIAGRAPQHLATAFRSNFDGKPEPLCAIWEPASRAAVDSWIAGGKNCPRDFMRHSDVALLELRNPRALDNINTTEEYLAARSTVDVTPAGSHPPAAGAAALQLRVQYFALLRDQAGRSEESVATTARTPRELYDELRTRHGLTLRAEQLRVAINEDFADWSRPLAAGDSVVFLPPVAGG